MHSKGIAIGLPLIAILLIALVIWRNAETEAPPAVIVDLACPAPARGCATRIGDRDVSLGLVGELKPLQPFQVWVRAPGAKAVKASFTMVGMNMGFNRYVLSRDGSGVFRAQVTLPTCVSGRRDWVMTLDIDRAVRLTVPFATSP